jgi:hypothetical protein
MNTASAFGRRAFIRLVGGGVLLAGAPGCSSDLPAEATAAWAGPAPDEADIRRWALGFAILAPHSHNLQSWLVDLRQPGEILLHCDLQRLLPETDPHARQILMSQGTFLELIDLAARERGHRAEIGLFPQGEFAADRPDARPVARVRLVPDAAVARDPLFAQIRARRTNREAYEPREPAPAALRAIAAATSAHALRVGFTTAAHPEAMQQLRAVADEAWRIELTTPRTIMESFRVLRVGPGEIARHRDGLSLNAPLVRALDAVGLFDRSRAPAPDSYATRSQLEDFSRKLQATPAFYWMVSEGNDRRTQVDAGRAYVRAQLAAAAHGLAMQPLSQALQEYPEQAGPYARIHRLLQAQPGRQVVQMWARLGYGPAIGPSPRRGVAAHLMPA